MSEKQTRSEERTSRALGPARSVLLQPAEGGVRDQGVAGDAPAVVAPRQAGHQLEQEDVESENAEERPVRHTRSEFPAAARTHLAAPCAVWPQRAARARGSARTHSPVCTVSGSCQRQQASHNQKQSYWLHRWLVAAKTALLEAWIGSDSGGITGNVTTPEGHQRAPGLDEGLLEPPQPPALRRRGVVRRPRAFLLDVLQRLRCASHAERAVRPTPRGIIARQAG